MNKARRKKITKIHQKLEELLSELEEVHDEEQEAYDNMPESLQESERGNEMYEAIENLDSAFNSVRR